MCLLSTSIKAKFDVKTVPFPQFTEPLKFSMGLLIVKQTGNLLYIVGHFKVLTLPNLPQIYLSAV